MVGKVWEKCIEVTKKLVCVLEVMDLCERVVVLWPSYAKERLEKCLVCLFHLDLHGCCIRPYPTIIISDLFFLVCFPKADYLFKIITVDLNPRKNETKFYLKSKEFGFNHFQISSYWGMGGGPLCGHLTPI
jgi:hypothetical protein